MDKHSLMNLVNAVSEGHLRIDTVPHPYIDDADVLDLLCRKAVETNDHNVRETLITMLKGNQGEANRRFAHIAIHAEDPDDRRWALINLSLMACRNAKEAVMQGLNDPYRSVRIAAAFNAGLYSDQDVVNSLELFFERNRPSFVSDGVCQSVKPFLPLMKKLGRLYSEYYRRNNTKNKPKERAQNQNRHPVFE